MIESPEVKAAQRKLDEAMHELVQVCAKQGEPLIGDEAILVGYTAILEGLKYDEDGHTLTSLGHVYENGEMRLSTAVGLLQLGLNSLLGIGNLEDD